MIWNNIPDELKQLNQWCISGPADKAPYTYHNGKFVNASPVQGPWLDFKTACELANEFGGLLSFILTESDPFSCIDLDVKDSTSLDKQNKPIAKEKWTPQEVLNGYCNVVGSFDSYTEVSASGKGLHIWVKGTVSNAVKREGVEIYSKHRSIVCTGKCVSEVSYSINNHVVSLTPLNYAAKPLVDRTDKLKQAEIQLNAGKKHSTQLVEVESELEDYEIVTMAMTSRSATKFNDLCRGDWEKHGYPSQSEADLALMSIFAFYSKSNEQCRRLFRMSELGKRDKAVVDNRYLDYALRLIRGRQILDEQIKKQSVAPVKKPDPKKVEKPDDPNVLPWPPGFVGYLAETIYSTANRPVREVAIVAAIGFMAGIVGKAFNISQTGLNIYMILVGRSAVGKEVMHTGPSMLIDAIATKLPAIHKFVNFNDFASGPSLIKEFSKRSVFVNIAGEWGKKFKRLSDEKSVDGPMQQLRTVMTNIYQKSGKRSIVGGISYSDKEKNVASISGVAYSMIGETTPGTLYESLTSSMMEDGFLSRFNVVEYSGNRPPTNENPLKEIPEQIVTWLSSLCDRVIKTMERISVCDINCSEEAERLLKEFDKKCDSEINKTDDESVRQMWNRAHLKALKIAGILAVGDNFISPVVTIDHAKWALDLIMRDINLIKRRMNAGDIGLGDDARERKILSLLQEYLAKVPKSSYKIREDMRAKSIVPRRYLLARTTRVSAFASHRLGNVPALDLTIRSLCDSGYIEPVDKELIRKEFGAQGLCFYILKNALKNNP